MKQNERPREKALRLGIEILSNRELLALLLRSGVKGKSALEVADQILLLRNQLGALQNVTIHELMQIKGISIAKGLEILACLELSKRISYDEMCEQFSIEHPASLIEWMNKKIGFANQEHFFVLFLDTANKIIGFKELFVGLLNSCNVGAKEIFKEAISRNSAKILLVHNHPSGQIEPSVEDQRVTMQLMDVADVCKIPILDHIIVGQNRYFSFKEKHLL